MIEDYTLRYLSARLDGVPGAIGQPSPMPPTCFAIKKTDAETTNMIPTDTLSIYAYAPSEYEAAQLNERIKQAMLAMARAGRHLQRGVLHRFFRRRYRVQGPPVSVYFSGDLLQ